MIRNPEIQFASADAIAAFQEERLRDEVAYLYENSPYYRRMFDGCGMQPGDIHGNIRTFTHCNTYIGTCQRL